MAWKSFLLGCLKGSQSKRTLSLGTSPLFISSHPLVFFYSSTEYSKESLVDYCTGHLKNSSSMECKSISCAGMTSQGLSLIATCNKKDVPDLWSARRIWVSAVSRFRSPYPTLYLGHVIYSWQSYMPRLRMWDPWRRVVLINQRTESSSYGINIDET